MTTILTTKHTCDEHGNWTDRPVRLTRKGNGWIEEFVPAHLIDGTHPYATARPAVKGEQVDEVAA